MFYQENHPGNLAKEIASAFDAAKTKMRISHEVNDVNFIIVKVPINQMARLVKMNIVLQKRLMIEC